jgi:hypothetical protein
LQDLIIEFIIRKKTFGIVEEVQDGINPTIVRELGFVEPFVYCGITK